MKTVRWFIKVIKKVNTSTFLITQGRSATIIDQQPEDGFYSEEAARAHKEKLVENGKRLTFRKNWRKK